MHTLQLYLLIFFACTLSAIPLSVQSMDTSTKSKKQKKRERQKINKVIEKKKQDFWINPAMQMLIKARYIFKKQEWHTNNPSKQLSVEENEHIYQAACLEIKETYLDPAYATQDAFMRAKHTVDDKKTLDTLRKKEAARKHDAQENKTTYVPGGAILLPEDD